MQYSSLRNAYGVAGFEELSQPVVQVQKQTQEQSGSQRDWMTAPPQPILSSAMPSAMPASYVPSPSGAPQVEPPPLPSQLPSYFPSPMPRFDNSWKHPNVHPLQRFDSNLQDVCNLCHQRTERDLQMIVIYIVSGIFLLAFLDIIVRLAMWLAKRK